MYVFQKNLTIKGDGIPLVEYSQLMSGTNFQNKKPL